MKAMEEYPPLFEVKPWTNVYAVAAIIYWSITGKELPNVLERFEGDILVPPSKLGVDIPPRAEAALLKALSVKPEDRFQSMKEFQEALAANSGQVRVCIRSPLDT